MSLEKFILMENSGNKVAIPISCVKEIVPKGDIVRVPKSKDYMVGIQNVRGEIINIIDIKKYLNISSSKESERVVICSLKDSLLGILAEDVNEILHLDTSEFEEIGEILGTSKENFYHKVSNYNGEPIIIADPNKLIALSD